MVRYFAYENSVNKEQNWVANLLGFHQPCSQLVGPWCLLLLTLEESTVSLPDFNFILQMKSQV